MTPKQGNASGGRGLKILGLGFLLGHNMSIRKFFWGMSKGTPRWITEE